MKVRNFESKSSHVALKFHVPMLVKEDSDETETFTLCESCFNILNDHICKEILSIFSTSDICHNILYLYMHRLSHMETMEGQY